MKIKLFHHRSPGIDGTQALQVYGMFQERIDTILESKSPPGNLDEFRSRLLDDQEKVDEFLYLVREMENKLFALMNLGTGIRNELKQVQTSNTLRRKYDEGERRQKTSL